MSDEYVSTFERLWVAFRAKWCQTHNLDGALAFTHDRVKIDFVHRVVQVEVDDSRADGLIDDALHLFKAKRFACALTARPPCCSCQASRAAWIRARNAGLGNDLRAVRRPIFDAKHCAGGDFGGRRV